MPATYEPIATTTLGSAASTITFSSIGAGYTDLRVVLVNTTLLADTVNIRFNSDTSTNYSTTILNGSGTTASSLRQTSVGYIEVANVDNANSLTTVDIFSYAGSTNKTCLITGSSDANGSGNVSRSVGLWRSTAAITSITFRIGAAGSSNFPIGTTATLYGILKA